MTGRCRSFHVAAAAAAAMLVCSPAGAQTAEDLFAAGSIHDLHLLVNARDLDSLSGGRVITINSANAAPPP